VLKKIIALMVIPFPALAAQEPFCPSGTNPNPSVLFCDNFDDGNPVSNKWNSYNSTGFTLTPGIGHDGSAGMRAAWTTGQVNAGAFSIGVGDLPQEYEAGGTGQFAESWTHNISVGGDEKLTEIYTRQYLKFGNGFVADGDTSDKKFFRYRILSDYKPNSSAPTDTVHPTAYQGHFWPQKNCGGTCGVDGNIGGLFYNSTRGVVDGVVVDTGNNCSARDCPHVWIPRVRGTTVLWKSYPSGSAWICIETHIKLNTVVGGVAQADGIEEFWFDGVSEGSVTNQNMRDTYEVYGINQVVFDNYWNPPGSPATNEMYRDNIVISTERINCLGVPVIPPPTETEGINLGSGVNLSSILPWFRHGPLATALGF